MFLREDLELMVQHPLLSWLRLFSRSEAMTWCRLHWFSLTISIAGERWYDAMITPWRSQYAVSTDSSSQGLLAGSVKLSYLAKLHTCGLCLCLVLCVCRFFRTGLIRRPMVYDYRL